MKVWIRLGFVALVVALLPVRPEAGPQSTQAQSARPSAGAAAPKPWPDAAAMAERKREADRRRLFRSEDPLPITLTANFKEVMRDRDPESTKTFPATIAFPASYGSKGLMPLRIRTRGHSR